MTIRYLHIIKITSKCTIQKRSLNHIIRNSLM